MKPRDDFADELRGFALLGIVVVNVPFLGISPVGFTAASLATPLDRAAAFAVVALAQAKFYVLFSFLFGYSLSYFLASKSADPFRAFRRRLAGLAGLGLLHAWLFFVGDILLLYALLGLALLWLARRPDRTALRTAAISAAAWLVVLGLLPLAPPTGEPVGLPAAQLALSSGSFLDAFVARLGLWPDAQVLILVLNGLAVLSLFCLGLVAGRHKLLAEPARHPGLWRRGLRMAAVIGVPGAALSAWMSLQPGASAQADRLEVMGTVLGFASAPALSFGYVSLLARIHTRWPGALRLFRPAGRMSLTGYLGESVILSFVFCGYGLGLLGRVGAAQALAIAIATWVVLDAFAHFWQRRFAYGPLEYVLRRWTHGARPGAIEARSRP